MEYSTPGEKGISMIIHGDPGVGKTSLAKTLNCDPSEILIISVDAGEYVLQDPTTATGYFCPVISIKEGELTKFRDVMKWLHTGDHSHKYVFIDNMTELEKFFLITLAGKRGEKAVPQFKDWGDSSFWMRKYIRDIRSLTYKGIDVIYIFWSMIQKIEDTDGSMTSQKVPMCMAKTTMEFCGLVDFVGYMDQKDDGTRYMQFDSDRMIKCKKRDLPGRELDKFEKPDLGAIFAKIKGEGQKNVIDKQE